MDASGSVIHYWWFTRSSWLKATTQLARILLITLNINVLQAIHMAPLLPKLLHGDVCPISLRRMGGAFLDKADR